MPGDINPAAILVDKASNYVGTLSDGTQYRLCVDTKPNGGVSVQQSALGSVSAAKIVNLPLLLGTAADMTVNGAVTNKVFTATMPANTTILSVQFMITSTGTFLNGNGFGGVGTGGLLGTNNPGALTNGIVLAVNAGGVNTVMGTFLTNDDLFILNGNGAVGSIGSGSLSTSTLILNQPFAGLGTDAITMTIRDNMTNRNIYLMRAYAKGIKTA